MSLSVVLYRLRRCICPLCCCLYLSSFAFLFFRSMSLIVSYVDVCKHIVTNKNNTTNPKEP